MWPAVPWQVRKAALLAQRGEVEPAKGVRADGARHVRFNLAQVEVIEYAEGRKIVIQQGKFFVQQKKISTQRVTLIHPLSQFPGMLLAHVSDLIGRTCRSLGERPSVAGIDTSLAATMVFYEP